MSELKILQGKARAIIIPIFILILGCASSTIGVFEEAFPSIPIFVRIASAMGYDTVVGIAVIVWGVKVKGWYFEDLSAVFLIMGIVSSLIMGWRPNTIAEKMAASFTDIAVACMIIGFSRGILVVLQSGHIIDTIVYGISIPLLPILGCIRGNARCSDLIKLPDSIRFRTGGYKYADYGSSCRLSWCFPSGICSGIPVRRWTFQYRMADRHGTNHVRNRRCKD